jgi:hypothetical protein
MTDCFGISLTSRLKDFSIVHNLAKFLAIPVLFEQSIIIGVRRFSSALLVRVTLTQCGGHLAFVFEILSYDICAISCSSYFMISH